MSTLAKVFVVFVFLLSVTFFGTSATLYLTREDWAQQYEAYRTAADAQVEQLKSRAEELKAALDDEQRAKQLVAASESKLDDALKRTLGDLEQANTTIAKVENERDEAQNQKAATDKLNASLVDESTALKEQLAAAHAARDESSNLQKVANAEKFRIKTVLDATERDLRDARVVLQETTEKYEQAETILAAYSKRFGALDGTVLAPPIDALVVEADAALKLIVLSVGTQDEVREGFEFTVYRDDRFVGKVRVHKVFENLAGARVLFTADGSDIRQGDRATTRIN